MHGGPVANAPCADEFASKCKQAELAIPRQMEIIGFFHESVAAAADSYFANVLSPLSEIVSFAVDQLINVIENKSSGQKTLFPYRLQHGETYPAK